MEKSPSPDRKRRRRWGSAENTRDLTDILTSYLTHPTKIQYGEDLGKTKLDKATLVLHGGLLLSLKSLQCNLVFAQSSVQAALREVGTSRRELWKFTEADLQDWPIRMSKRIRCMCAHFATACRKQQQPKWLNEIYAIKGSDLTCHTVETIENAPADPIEKEPGEEDTKNEFYYVGWNTESNTAWRVSTTDTNQVPELTDNISFKSDALDTDEVTATWGDRYSMTVPGLTVGQWKARTAAKEARGGKKVAEWTDKEYFVRIKKDRHGEQGGLAWLGHINQKSKQLCQLYVHKVASKDVAVQILAKVAQKLAAGSTDAYMERNKLMEEAGIHCKKKPEKVKKKVEKVVKASTKKPCKEEEAEEEEDSSVTETEVEDNKQLKTMERFNNFMSMNVDIAADVYDM
eukprot:98512-Lingulodinium_polyedra.AAC.1